VAAEWVVATVATYKYNTYGDGSKPWYLVNPKIAGKWMFIPLELIIIGFDPPPYTYIYIHIHMGGRRGGDGGEEHPQNTPAGGFIPMPEGDSRA